MSLNDFSNIVVSSTGAALTQVGFGTLLIADYHTRWAERTRTYTDTAGMVADGFLTTDPAYKAAQRAFGQSPRPTSIKIGRLALAPTQTQRITPLPLASTVYSITLTKGAQTGTATYTSDASPLVDEICDGLETAINALAITGLTVVPLGGATATALDLNCAVGTICYLKNWDVNKLRVEDRTPDPGIATDLDNIRLADADWYGLGLTLNARAIIEEAADWAEAQDVIFGYNTSDWQAPDAAQTVDIGDVLQGKSYIRSIGTFSLSDTESYAGVASLAERFPSDPGSPGAGGTFHGKTLAGVSADALTPTQKANLRAKNYQPYITTAGRNHTLDGKSSSGEFIDKTRFVDWFRIRLQERFATIQLDNDRVPYDEIGLSMYYAACQAQVSEGLKTGGIAATPAPTVVVPTIAETDAADRSARVLRNISIEFRYAGAIHKADPVNITVTV